MFCPVCGNNELEQLYGGMCGKGCVKCGKGIYCRDPLSNEIEEDSLPVEDWDEAEKLRLTYQEKANKKEN